VTDDEIQVVAEELAKVGGLSWYPGRPSEAFLKALTQDYLEHARAAIAALDRMRASRGQISNEPGAPLAEAPSHPGPKPDTADTLKVGDVVEFHPPGDKRTITCRIEELKEGHARLEPMDKPDIGWVTLSIPLRSSAQGRPGEG
jgi:hypothetical protein